VKKKGKEKLAAEAEGKPVEAGKKERKMKLQTEANTHTKLPT
jgi:hypothetical protein